MTKVSSFYRTTQTDLLEKAQESLAAAGEYRDREDGSGGWNDGDETLGSCGGARCDNDTICFVAYLASFVGICFVLLGSFYLPPEAGANGGRVIVFLGGVFLTVSGPGLVATCCCPRRRHRVSSAASDVEVSFPWKLMDEVLSLVLAFVFLNPDELYY